LPAAAPKVARATAALGLSLFLVDCVDTRSDAARRDGGTGGDPADAGGDDTGTDAGTGPSVTVDVGAERAVVAPYHFGMHSSVYDNALHHEELPAQLQEAGIGLLRWPGGGYSDNYHFSNHSMTPFSDGSPGYLAAGSDFGSFIGLIDRVGTGVMISVNYGSNLAGDGPGEPKEAAAWVAYANGEPDDDREIGVDGSGNDWQTVGYWAGLRASEPLAEDDGYNFLRIARAEPLAVEYWEVGNEVFGNGFHQGDMTPGFELDLHVPYPGEGDDPMDPQFLRYGNPLLSGKTYGAGVRAYAEEMKAVDPSIKIGAVLGTPPADESWMTVVVPSADPEENPDPTTYHWNTDVISECGDVIDFGIVHWYPNPASIMSGDPCANPLQRLAAVLGYPKNVMPVMVSMLRETFAEFAGDNAENIEIVMTEVGTGITVPTGRIPMNTMMRFCALNRGHGMGIYAADMYLTAAEQGFVNVDWLELHNGTFLNERTTAKGPAFSGIRMASLLAGPGDRLVTATSTTPLVAHAALREDGRVGVLVINTQAPELSSVTATVTINGARVSGSGERYDYFPKDQILPEGIAVPTNVASVPYSLRGESGDVTGPESFTGMESPFTVELPPYGVSLFIFDAD
jgi:hypothetical protein